MASLLERITTGVKNMLSKRGYDQFSELKVQIGSAFTASSTKPSLGDTLIVYVPHIADETVTKVKNETVHLLYYLMESLEPRCSHAVLVYSELAPQAAEILRSHSVYRTEVFQYKNVLFDPTEHEKTPPHHRMSPEEIAVELRGVKPSQLPSILITDVIVKYYDWRVGDIIRITRPDGPYYRIVSR